MVVVLPFLTLALAHYTQFCIECISSSAVRLLQPLKLAALVGHGQLCIEGKPRSWSRIVGELVRDYKTEFVLSMKWLSLVAGAVMMVPLSYEPLHPASCIKLAMTWLRQAVPLAYMLQRRRLYIHQLSTRWEDSKASCQAKLQRCVPTGRRTTLELPMTRGGLCGLHDFHTVRGTDFILSVEVAECRSPPEISKHVLKQFKEKWALADKPVEALSAIME